MSNFSTKNSHDENIKVSISKILGTDALLKKPKITAANRKRNLFYSVIDNLIALQMRENELESSFMLDLYEYNTPFYLVINTLLKIHFTRGQVNLIHFYLYERITPEGYMVDLMAPDGSIMDLSSPEKLYDEILNIK